MLKKEPTSFRGAEGYEGSAFYLEFCEMQIPRLPALSADRQAQAGFARNDTQRHFFNELLDD